MSFKAQYIPYSKTGSFSKIVTDYLSNVPALQSFYNYTPDITGIKKAIADRKKYTTNRKVLVDELQKQYSSIQTSDRVKANVEQLLQDNTFTICTAHQPNIFTGHLYFLYKILHAIKLADELNETIKDAHFVPVYYMGSEDADLAELGEVNINGKQYRWQTDQKGAVGRMKIDKPFIKLIDEIQGQLSVEPFGKEISEVIKQAYQPGKTIEQATFELVHGLFAEFGLVILLPDNVALKTLFIPVVRKELEEQFSQQTVAETIAQFPAEYKVQAAGRELNLFYLKDDTRERIEVSGNNFTVANTTITFSKKTLLEELNNHPERFSANVILRPVFQEIILPNIAFIGGGGELAYWLELKKVFEFLKVPFPVLLLRNSFMIVNKKNADKIQTLQFTAPDFFAPADELIKKIVERESSLQLDLDKESAALTELYKKMGSVAATIDSTLEKHAAALHTSALKRITSLQKKMFKAEKKKFEAQQRQVEKIKSLLFPNGTLQERIDNLLPYYALFGKDFLRMLYENSKGLAHEFCILEED